MAGTIALYSTSFVVVVVTSALSLIALIAPNWIRFSGPPPLSPTITVGLDRRCSSVFGDCRPYPVEQDCVDDDTFCGLWRTSGFLVYIAGMTQFVLLVTYVTILLGGRARRDNGWKPLTAVQSISATCQAVAMSIIAYLFNNSPRFAIGWHLDYGWICLVVAFAINLMCGILVGVIGYLSPPEYQQIPQHDAD